MAEGGAAQTVFSGRYEMVRHIARGGMAQVYLAQDLLLDRPVALKVLFPELSVDRSFVERFRREAKAAANLSHPNIVSVYDWGQGENTYFIVMEYVDGPTLSSILNDGPLEPHRAAAIAAAVAAALDFAHRRGVIHRDVKPGNVLIDARSQVKVADFGIARAIGTSENLTQTGSVMGTATYFSPEQAQGYPVDPRSDVYSLGVVLYEMVAGRPPFSGDSPVAIAYQHVKEPVPPPRSVNPTVPAALESVVLKAMAKDPANRYQSAEDMRADLGRFAAGQTVTAPPTAVLAATGVLGPPGGVVSNTEVHGVVGGPGPNGSSRGGLWALLALILIALLVGGYFAGREAGLWGGGTQTLKVPTNLVGQQVANARSELSAIGFTNVAVSPRTNPAPAGQVVASDPSGGASIVPSARLTLVVSNGPVQVLVPTVANLPYQQADQDLFAKGFVPTNTTSYSATVTRGHVISTTPAGGASAAQGSHVTVVVSGGVQPVQVPSVVGDSQAQAGAVIGAAGLTVSSVVDQPSTTVTAGEATGTNPPAGSSEPTGTGVVLYVSSGAPMTTVPNLSGDTQAQAGAALSADHLAGSYTSVPVTDPSQNGLVQGQNPSAGTSEPYGTTVDVEIGQYSPPSTTTSTTDSTTTTTSTLPGGNGGGGGGGGGKSGL